MSANKENVKAIETRKSTKKGNREDPSDRNPLKTLSFNSNAETNLAGPSSGSSRPLDTRYVTHRNRNHYEEFDWGFMVFEDTPRKPDTNDNKAKNKINEKTSVSEILKKHERAEKESNKVEKSEKEPSACEKYESNRGNKTGNTNQVNPEKRTQKTQPNKENIIYTIDLTEEEEDKTDKEDIVSSDIEVGLSVEKCFDPLNKAYMMDNLNYLLQTEKKVLREPRIKRALRSSVMNWIINANGANGNPAVVQVASWYFNSYFSSARVTNTELQVLAAACYWIATKFDGQFISMERLLKYSGHTFIKQDLVEAERKILRKLKFQPLPVTPHDYVPYLAWCCNDNSSGVLEAAAVFLCQCGVLTAQTLSEEYPSVVATAAVKNALILLRMDARMHKLSACPVFKAAMKKTANLDATCTQLRDAVRVVASEGYEYKAPLFKFSKPPLYISHNIVRAVNHKDIVLMDIK